ncbi:hypothetical protein DMENIID0001_042310 [Sergentomyia squamirostris]
MPETLGHIMGICIHTKSRRIRRHNEIRDLITDGVASKDPGAVLSKEPSLSLPDGARLQPDLVVKNRDGVFVVDFTVRHEDGYGLARVHGQDIKIRVPSTRGAVRELYH